MLNIIQFSNLFAIEQFKKFIITVILKKKSVCVEGNWRMSCKQKKGVGDLKEMNGETK